MNDGVRVVAKRHQHTHDGLEVQARCHTTDLGMNTPQSSGTASTGIWLSVFDNSIDKPIDLRVGASISSTVAKATQCLHANSPNDRVGINDKFLGESALALCITRSKDKTYLNKLLQGLVCRLTQLSSHKVSLLNSNFKRMQKSHSNIDS